MFATLFRFFGFSLLGMCFLAINLIFVILILLIRFLPRLFPWVRQGLRIFLLLSFRFYQLILIHLAQRVYRSFGVDLLNPYWRLVICTLLSLGLGLLIPLFTRTSVNGWAVMLTCFHGLLVSLIWDEIENPKGIHLGTRIL